MGISIDDRPAVVNDRGRVGDWEGDTVESKDHKPRRVVSVGFVLREDKVGISICQSYDTEKHDDHALFIPAGMIQKIEDIK